MTRYTDIDRNTQITTTAVREACKHRNGWYIVVPFLHFWRRRLFVCSDCGHWERVS